MKVVFRVDASTSCGMGHAVRCRTLADVLRRRGAEVRFVCRAHLGNMGAVLARDAFPVTLLPMSPAAETPLENNDNYAAWLGVTPEQDAIDTITALQDGRPDWLIVDHYGLDAEWERKLRSHVGRIMAIDDIANRFHDCDVLLDQNYSEAAAERYAPWLNADCLRLFGPRYALLRPEYADYRKNLPQRMGTVGRVLVFFGTEKNISYTSMVLEVLSGSEFKHLDVDVVIVNNNSHRLAIEQQVFRRAKTNLYTTRPHLADLMANADLAIGAGGTTTWERMCMGVPSIVVSISENQRPACEALSRQRLIHYVEPTVTDLKKALSEMLINSGDLRIESLRGQILVDGRGAERVAEVLWPSEKKDFRLRGARETDVLNCFVWNDEDAMAFSFCDSSSSKRSDDADEDAVMLYGQLFSKRLNDPNTHLFIIEANGLPLGQIGFTRDDKEIAMEHSLDSFVRGRGWSDELVRLGIKTLYATTPKLLNEASIAPFFKSKKRASTKVSSYSIAILSDRGSWLNAWLPKLVRAWIEDGHKILWAHDIGEVQAADFCFYLSFGQIVPAKVRTLFRHNLVVHESDLPQGKGWSPLTWQILEGKSRVPVTLIEAEDKVDSGVIYGQRWMGFEGHELVNELRARQALATMELCEEFVEKYPAITFDARQQTGDESFYPRRTAADSRIDRHRTITEQFNLLRIVDNERYPAWFEVNGRRYRLLIEGE